MWLATSGHFILSLWPDMTLRSRHIKPLYTDEQKAELLLAGLNQNDIRPPSVTLD